MGQTRAGPPRHRRVCDSHVGRASSPCAKGVCSRGLRGTLPAWLYDILVRSVATSRPRVLEYPACSVVLTVRWAKPIEATPMTKTTSAAFLAAALLGSGCVIVNHGQSGDITFTWTFNGRSCAQAGISQVQVTIPGETLDNGGLYACTVAGSDGITLHSFAAGTYDYTLQGLNAGGTVTYQASGSFGIDGDQIVHADLMPVGGPTSYALLGWTFPANWASAAPDCANATATYVDVQIDGGDWTRYACA